MPWREVSPGRYEREFDSLECFYLRIAAAGAPLQKEHYFISTAIKLKEISSEIELRRAWKALRFQYPQIAALPDSSGSRFTYTVPSPEDIETWMRTTFIVASETSSVSTLYSTLTPSPLFKLYYLPHSKNILFRTPHWRIDGTGIKQLQDVYLRILTDGPVDYVFDGSEGSRLLPSLDEAASVPQETTPEIRRAVGEELGIFTAGQPSVSIPTLPNALPATTREYRIELPADLTCRIISACKARGLTVTTAAHAALIIATLPYAQHNFDPATRGLGGGKYTTFGIFDLRKYLPVPWNGFNAAAGVYHTGLPLSVDLDVDKDFNAISATLRSYYGRNLAEDQPRNIFQYLAEHVRGALSLLSAAPKDPLLQPAHAALSSQGIVNKYVQIRYTGKAATVEVEDWWLGVEVIDRGLMVLLWTWNDRLCLVVNYNDAFYEQKFVQEFVEGWKKAFINELGLQ